MKSAGVAGPIEMWVDAPPAADVMHALDRLARTEDVVKLAVLPDVHLASEICVGVAVATEQLLFPAAVGGDIGCGMLPGEIETKVKQQRATDGIHVEDETWGQIVDWGRRLGVELEPPNG